MTYEEIAASNPTSLTQDRWSNGIDHHPMSVALMNFLAKHDYNDYKDYFCWKTGGDGDNGEFLMFQMDPFFEWLEQQNPDASHVVDGQVAVVYRPAYGIGWSSHGHDNKKARFLALNGRLARLVEAKDWVGVEALVKARYPDMYLGSVDALRIQWVNQGTLFEITERDGYETIHIKGQDYLQAV